MYIYNIAEVFISVQTRGFVQLLSFRCLFHIWLTFKYATAKFLKS